MNISKTATLQKDKIIFWSFLTSFILLLITLLYIVINFSTIPPYLPIYNKLPWGYTRLGSNWQIFIPLGITVIFTIINTFITKNLQTQNPLLARLLSITNAFICLFTCIFTIKIISIVV